jgi:hypothetical protein
MTKRFLGAGVALALALIACSSSKAEVSPDEACQSFSNSVCTKYKSCFPEVFAAVYTDVASCAARQSISCKNTLNAKSTAATPADAQACGSAFESASCDAAFLTDHQPLDACKPKTGGLADGTACQDDSQCKTGYCKFGTSSCGACGTRQSAGSKCESTSDCEFGLVCGGTGTCVKAGAAGDTCSKDKPCGGRLVCKTSTAGSTTGTCAAPGNAGDSCSGNDCDENKALFCNPQSKTCQTVSFAAPGAACGVIGGGYTACQGSGSVCKVGDGTTSGTCKAGPKDGEACGTDTGGCQSPARCVNGVCTLPTSCGG